MSMKYITTKKQCQYNIDRRQPIVCTRCGGKLSPIRTVDNSNRPTYWAGCKKCNCFNGGTTPRLYEIAKSMVIHKRLRPYSHNKEPDEIHEPAQHDYWLKSQICGAVSIVEDVVNLLIK
jgi:hypothetical protein